MFGEPDGEQTIKTLMVIYSSQLRYKIDYGCIVYNSGNCTDLGSLESDANDGMVYVSRYEYKSNSVLQNPVFKCNTLE